MEFMKLAGALNDFSQPDTFIKAKCKVFIATNLQTQIDESQLNVFRKLSVRD